MKVICYLITIILIIQCILVTEINTQRSAMDFVQTALESTLTTGGNLMKKLIPSSSSKSQDEIVTSTSEVKQAEGDIDEDQANGGIIPDIIGTLKEIRLPDVLSLVSTNGSLSGLLPTKIAQGIIEDLTSPVKDAGADIVEGAVKTGVDQAMSSITDSFKVDVVLVVAVLVIQIILFVCGVHLCFYVYKREKEMRDYVKQQVNLTRTRTSLP